MGFLSIVTPGFGGHQSRSASPVCLCSLRPAGIDVVVQVEHVFGVVASLHLNEPVIVRPVGHSHRVGLVVVAEIVEPRRFAK
jgi:hypothetical protein